MRRNLPILWLAEKIVEKIAERIVEKTIHLHKEENNTT